MNAPCIGEGASSTFPEREGSLGLVTTGDAFGKAGEGAGEGDFCGVFDGDEVARGEVALGGGGAGLAGGLRGGRETAKGGGTAALGTGD